MRMWLQVQIQVGQQKLQPVGFTCVPGATDAARTTVTLDPGTMLSTVQVATVTVAPQVGLSVACSAAVKLVRS